LDIFASDSIGIDDSEEPEILVIPLDLATYTKTEIKSSCQL
jgi:hypothetical protein